MTARNVPKADLEERRMTEILKILKREYPEAECSLSYQDPFQLLVATILSAQCTDARVNQVTPALFKKYPKAADFAQADRSELEERIRSTGFFRSKARSIQETAQALMAEHGGKVPNSLEALTQLRGVGRKTANVVLGVAYQVPGLVVDTHVKRLSYRMGFTRSKDPKVIEQEMMKIVPKKDWILFAHLLIDHGRKICTARRAKCEICPVAPVCPKILA